MLKTAHYREYIPGEQKEKKVTELLKSCKNNRDIAKDLLEHGSKRHDYTENRGTSLEKVHGHKGQIKVTPWKVEQRPQRY